MGVLFVRLLLVLLCHNLVYHLLELSVKLQLYSSLFDSVVAPSQFVEFLTNLQVLLFKSINL